MTTSYASPYALAKELDEDFDYVVEYCAEHGFVHIDHECVVCAYPFIETQSKKELDKPDAWLVCMAVGNLKKAFSVIDPLPKLAFERYDGRIRVYDFEKFRRVVWAVLAKS